MKRIAPAVLIVCALSGFSHANESEKSFVSGSAAFEASFADFKTVLAEHAADPSQARQKLLDEKLISAVRAANVVEIRRLVAMGANPNAYDGYNSTPLSVAVYSHGDVAVLNALIELGALVDFKGTCDYTALHVAARDGRIDAAKVLIAHHAAVDAKGCLGDTPLGEAAANGRAEVFKYLLGLGANPNAAGYMGKTPFLHSVALPAAPQDNQILAALLADARTNVNVEPEDGLTALKFAVKGKNLDLVKLLLSVRGIDVNCNAGGTTALFLADLYQYEEIAQLLRAAGARQFVAVR